MSWELGDKEFAAVLSLTDRKRYDYFIKHVADWGEVWSLYGNDGWVLASDEAGRELIPIWPHSRYAAACADGIWSATQPKAIDIHDWQAIWIPGILNDKRMVAVFPLPNNKGIPLPPGELKHDLDEALSEIE